MGETIYVVSDDKRTTPTVSAWDVTNGKFIAKKNILLVKSRRYTKCILSYLAVVKEGIVASPRDGTLELWNFELSSCLRRWTQLFKIIEIISISADRVACVNEWEWTATVIILDTSAETIMSKIQIGNRYFVSCNSKCQLLTYRRRSFQLCDGSVTVWRMDMHALRRLSENLPSNWIPQALFSPAEQFVVTWSTEAISFLDAVSGQTLHILRRFDRVSDCKFVSDEECVVSSRSRLGDYSLQLFNVKSGHLLSKISFEREAEYLAACPRTHLLAINQCYPKHSFGYKLMQVQLVQDKGSRKSKR